MQGFLQLESDKMRFKRKIHNDYTLSVIAKITTAAIGIVSSAFSTRYLGVQYKGDYSYITHVVNIIVLILNLGIYQSYSYNYKKYGRDIIYKYTNICFLQFIILFFAMLFLLIIVNDPLISMIIVLVPFSIIKLQYGNIVLIENFRLSMWLSVFNSLMNMACYIALFFWAKPRLLYVVGVTVIIDIITVIVYVMDIRIVPYFWNIDIPFLKSVLRFGVIPMLSGLLATVNYSIDIIFLKKIGVPEELSYYALAANIVNYVWLLPDAFKSVLFSKSARKFDKDSIEFSSQISSFFIFLCFISFAILGKFLLGVFYGKEFINSYKVTLLLIIGAFSMSIYKLLGIVLVSQGRRVAHFASLAISAVVNVILNCLLIPKMGMYGAGLASVCSYSLCGGILLIYFCNLYDMKPHHLLLLSSSNIKRMTSRLL